MSNTPKIWGVIPAAGLGSRFGSGSAKQYAVIGGMAILEHSVSVLLQHNLVQKIVVALHCDDTRGNQLPLLQHEKICLVQGGAERADSVLHALRYLESCADMNDWVLVHDAARPCLSAHDLEKLVSTLMDDAVGGILAVPATDTLKKVEADCIVCTLDRTTIWQAQTPQMFRLGLLLECLQQACDKKTPVTDEASAVEACGYAVKIIQASRSNIKITYQEDLALAAFYLRQEYPL